MRGWLLRGLRGVVEWLRSILRSLFAIRFLDSPWAASKLIPMHADRTAFLLPKIGARSAGDSPDGIPVPPKHLWVGYAEEAARYLEIGRQNAERMRSLLSEAGCDIRDGDRVLDFGCAAGPMLRALNALDGSCELWGVDISSEHVHWCVQNFPARYRWAVTTTGAHLPFEDHFFDLVYCGSVFSHIGETADAWILELARVIRPGGTLYVTLVTREAMRKYLDLWPRSGLSRELRALFSPAELASDFDALYAHRYPWMHAVYDLGFFRRKCEWVFDVLSVTPDVYTFQYAMVLRRREMRRRRPAAP